MRNTIRAVLIFVVIGTSALAQAPRSTSAHGLATDRAARIDALFQRYVDEGRLAGAVALVLQDGQPIYEHAFGWSDKEANRKMTTDTIFRIASQSKAITSAAILSLVEEGKIAVTDPASRFIPGFAKTTVAVQTDGETKIVPARRQILVRDLLTHTAGISYGVNQQVAAQYEAKGLGPAAGYGWYTADKTEPICDSMERLASLPFVAQPGEAWVYGYNTDVLGCIAERASGMPLDQLVRTRITGPLGMKDTQFFLSPSERTRLAAVYSLTDGKIARAPDGARGQGHYVDGPRKSFAGGAGLLSTARDYARFMEAMRNGGTLDGVRILSPRSVALMATNQVGTLHPMAGMGFGFGFETTDRYGAKSLESVGSYGWSGAYGSTYRVDPQTRTVMILMIQVLPNTSDIAERYSNTVYQALLDEAPRAGTR